MRDFCTIERAARSRAAIAGTILPLSTSAPNRDCDRFDRFAWQDADHPALPKIENRIGTIREEEGCLSLPGIFGVVERSKTITVKATDADGKSVSFEATALKARIVQHELDHLDGVLFIDRVDPVTRDRIKRKIKKDGLREDASRHAFAL